MTNGRWWDRQTIRISPWVKEGYDRLVEEMAPPGWEPSEDDADADGDEADETPSTHEIDGAQAEESEGGSRESEHERDEEVEQVPGVSVDEEPELPRERAVAVLTEYYESRAEATDAIDQLLNRGWIYEVDGAFRVTDRVW